MSNSTKRSPYPKRLRLADIIRKRLMKPADFWSYLARVVR